MSGLHFFGSSNDIKQLLIVVEKNISLQFVQAGRLDSLSPIVFHSSTDIPDLGLASHQSSSSCRSYLVSRSGLEVYPRRLQSAPFFAFDQLGNPKTVVFNPGGLWKNEVLIRGDVGTASKDNESGRILRAFGVAFAKKFTRVRGVFVGTEAEELWKQGRRLTIAEQSPKEFDLAP